MARAVLLRADVGTTAQQGIGSPREWRSFAVRERHKAHDRPMTYCIGVLLQEGLVMASDSRTHAGVDNFATFCKMTVFERPGERVVVLLSSGSLAGTQAVISILKQRGESRDPAAGSIWSARTMFDVAVIVSDAVRDIERRDGEHLAKSSSPFNASFIIGGQIKGEPPRLFRTFAEGNFIEASSDTPFFQTGETKYGKPIIDRVIGQSTSLSDAMKCVLVSFDSTMRSNLSVGMPIDLACYAAGDLKLTTHHRFAPGDAYFVALSKEWSDGVRQVFRGLTPVPRSSSSIAEAPPGDRYIRFEPAP